MDEFNEFRAPPRYALTVPEEYFNAVNFEWELRDDVEKNDESIFNFSYIGKKKGLQ